MNTRRYPRTMQEAFGPYTSHDIHEPFEYKPTELFVFAVVLAVSTLTLLTVVYAVCQ